MEKRNNKEIKPQGPIYPIYLDTSILWHFSISLNHPHFSILIEIAKKWNFNVYIPEMAYLEWLNSKKKDIQASLGRMISNKNDIEEKYLYSGIGLSEVTVKEIFEHSKSILDKNLKINKVETIETSDIDLRKLINMSVQKIRPFEEKREKGFRDSVLLFTILNHAKSLNAPCTFISNDKVFKHDDVKKNAAEEGVEFFLFESIEKFKETTEKIKQHIIQEVRESKLKELENFLQNKQEKIHEFIREKGKFNLTQLNMLIKPQFPDYEEMLKSIHRPSQLLTIPNIIKINNIDLTDIRAPSLPVETEKEFIPVYFNVKLKLQVTIAGTYSPYFDKRISVEGIEFKETEFQSGAQITEEEIEGEFPIYASIKVTDGKYSELLLKQIGSPWPSMLAENIWKSSKK